MAWRRGLFLQLLVLLAFFAGRQPAPAALLVFDRLVSDPAPYFTDIALDTQGNIHLSGFSLAGEMPRALVTKRSPDGATEIWTLQFGAGNGQIATGITVDAQGNVYVTGWTADPNFPLENPLQPSFGGGETDVFILKIDPTGSRLIYSTFLGGNGDDFANQIRVDTSGNAYVVGTTFSPQFPGSSSATSGETDAFVVKLSPNGSATSYRRLLGGSGTDLANGIALDSQGRAYVIGSTSSTNFPLLGPLQSENKGGLDAFVAILDANGDTTCSTYLGGSGPETGTGIALDPSGDILITGLTYSPDFPLKRPIQNQLGNAACPDGKECGDGFVTKLNPTASAMEFSTYLGGDAEENPNALTSSLGFTLYGIGADAAGFIYVTGTTASMDFPVLGGLQVSRRRGASDLFLAKFQPDGAVVYSTYVGPGQVRPGEFRANVASSLVVLPQGDAYLAGTSLAPSVGPGANSGPIGYLAKVSDLPVLPTSSTPLPETGGNSGFLSISDIRRLADRSAQITFSVPTNSGYVVEGSTNLRAWTPLFTRQPPDNGGIRE